MTPPWRIAGSIYSDAIVLACGHEVGCDEIGDKCRHCAAENAARPVAQSSRFVEMMRQVPHAVLMGHR